MVTATLYDMVCLACKKETTRWSDYDNFLVCDCGGALRVKRKDHAPDGDYEHISETLGINPIDMPEHRKHWPNIEALPDGRLKFKSVREQEKYAHHFGLDKKQARIR